LKGIPYEQLKDEMLNSPEAIQAYEEAGGEIPMTKPVTEPSTSDADPK
jgi:hypothetical protein